MTTYRVRSFQVTKGVFKQLDLSPNSGGAVVLFEASSADPQERELQEARASSPRRLLVELAAVRSKVGGKLGVEPPYTGTIHLLEAIDGALPPLVTLPRVLAGIPGDEAQHPQPPIVQGFPPRPPRRVRDFMIARASNELGRILYRAGVGPSAEAIKVESPVAL